ncbi:MAG: amidophosphoribosyltransferase, partial [Chloroflexota bacterium]|nr:amidophosphoribosyltransferase [Chloroflexota bacterium]
MKECCALFGVYAPDEDVARLTYFGLFAQQHRGQESSGIVTSDGDQFYCHTKMGLVSQVFDEDILSQLCGHIAIGHNRYSTTGSSHAENAQPLIVEGPAGKIALAHNGNLVNAVELRQQLESQGLTFHTTSDSEIIAYLILTAPQKSWVEKIRHAMKRLIGAYSLVILTEDTLYGVRDPLGVRPLCMGELNGGWMLASESCAPDHTGAQFLRDIEPNEIVSISENGVQSDKEGDGKPRGLCIFEYIYFARPDSIIEGRRVYSAREAMGAKLSQMYPVEADVAFGLPDSATAAGIGYAQASGIPFSDILLKNRYVGRTFIEPHQRLRELGVQQKFNPMRERLEGKRAVIVDDSIVRGTTTPRVVALLRNVGAKEIHMRICAPPLKYPCCLGVDMATSW